MNREEMSVFFSLRRILQFISITTCIHSQNGSIKSPYPILHISSNKRSAEYLVIHDHGFIFFHSYHSSSSVSEKLNVSITPVKIA